MKNILLIWNGVLTVLVLGLAYKMFSSQSVISTNTSPSSFPMAVIQSDSLLNQYELFKDIKKELETERSQIEANLTNRGRTLQNELLAAQKRASTMSPQEIQALEGQFAKKQQDLVAFRESSLQKISANEQQKMQKLYQSIGNFFKKSDKYKNYSFVLGQSQGSGILYSQPSLDITSSVIEGLNKEYKSKK